MGPGAELIDGILDLFKGLYADAWNQDNFRVLTRIEEGLTEVGCDLALDGPSLDVSLPRRPPNAETQ